jgi:CubicO group peptidase (beta-lactamase class C family)
MYLRNFLIATVMLFTGIQANAQVYHGIQAGKFLRDWYLAGPLKVHTDSSAKPDDNAQQQFFNRENNQQTAAEFIIPAGGSPDLKKWKKYSSGNDNVDLDSVFNHPDFVSAYAYAVIELPAAQTAMFGIGSDDAVKVWHNGKLVHKNWVPRAIVKDNDVIPLSLVKGKNEILIEVQDIQEGWGFTTRFLDQKALTNKLVKSASIGDMDEATRMISSGANVNGKSENGITPLDASRINGREDITKLLKSKGAIETEVASPVQMVDGFYSRLNKIPDPGISVLIAKDGKILYSKGYGYADIQNKIKITPQTKFRIGSITKQFIASAIMKLQEDGKINVKDKLSKYFPDFPHGDEVTIHHLLTHTSGIHSFTSKDSFLVDVLKPVTNEQELDYFKNDSFDFKPGERWQYNNSGYFLLGYIIEKITGDKYGNYLKKNFFDPLGMTNTGVHSPKLKLTNEALGYEKANNVYKRALDWNMDWAGGAGSLYSTTEDLYKWNEAVFNNKVLKPESMKAVFTPVVLNNDSLPPGVKYGYGWFLDNYRGLSTIGHSGGLHGFISQLMRVPDKNLTVILLTNVLPPEVELDPMKIAELYLWKDMLKQASFAKGDVEEKGIEKYTGRYDITNGMVMTVTKEADGLYAQVSGQAKYPIYQSSPGHYFWKVVEATVVFITDKDGNVTHGHFEQGSFRVDAVKMKEIAAVKADTALFEMYKGVYKYKQGTDITITSKNGKLYGQATGDIQYELTPLSDTEFLVPVLNATLTFKKDATGKVNAVHLKLAGDERDAPKAQ